MTLVLTMQQKIRGNAGNALLRRPSSSQQNFTHTHDLPPKTLIDKIYAPERLEKEVNSVDSDKVAEPDSINPIVIQKAWNHIKSIIRSIMI